MAQNLNFVGEVYVSTCLANYKSYVGQTTQGVQKRWKLHLRCARSPRTPAYRNLFSKAIRKHGSGAFEHQTLSVAGSQAELDNLEKIWIILFQTKVPNGYNLTDGGDSGTAGHIVSPEVRARLSLAAKSQWRNPEYREKHRQGMISSGRRGRKDSLETIEKRVSKIRGVKQSAEAIAHRVSVLRGKKRTQEFREQCAVRMRGRKLSKATRMKMSQSQRARQEKNHGA
jgi:group I intron endonuclease